MYKCGLHVAQTYITRNKNIVHALDFCGLKIEKIILKSKNHMDTPYFFILVWGKEMSIENKNNNINKLCLQISAC